MYYLSRTQKLAIAAVLVLIVAAAGFWFLRPDEGTSSVTPPVTTQVEGDVIVSTFTKDVSCATWINVKQPRIEATPCDAGHNLEILTAPFNDYPGDLTASCMKMVGALEFPSLPDTADPTVVEATWDSGATPGVLRCSVLYGAGLRLAGVQAKV